jgi:hypothetical protein
MSASTVNARVDRAVLTRRWPTWLGVAQVALLVVTGLRTDFANGIVVAAIIYWVWGAVRGQLWRPGWLTLETAGVAVFGALTLAALTMDAAPARYLLAAGWLAHAAWDVAHHRANRIVPRWYAECCAVVDVLLAAAILILPPT